MNYLEFREHLYNASIQATAKDVKHFRVGGEKNGIRKYQNLDGSLTPLGRIHYGVGMSREEMRAEREAEDSRQRNIDYNRSKSIREMDNQELSEAIDRSRDELMFERNMQNRAENFLRSRNLEEQLNQEYENMLYNKSQLKANRFMARVERIGRFVGNLSEQYGKVVDVKSKLEDARWRAGMADQEMWRAEKEKLNFEDTAYYKRKDREKFEREKYEPWKRQMDERDAKWESEAKAAKKQAKLDAKQAKKEAKEAKKAGDPAYIRKEGDTYIYDDSTKSKWQSFKDKLKEKKEAKAEAKRNDLKAEAKKQIADQRFDYRDSDNLGYLNNNRTMQRMDASDRYVINEINTKKEREKKDFDRNYGVYKSFDTGKNSSYDWASAMSKANSKKSEPSLSAPKPEAKKQVNKTTLSGYQKQAQKQKSSIAKATKEREKKEKKSTAKGILELFRKKKK